MGTIARPVMNGQYLRKVRCLYQLGFEAALLLYPYRSTQRVNNKLKLFAQPLHYLSDLRASPLRTRSNPLEVIENPRGRQNTSSRELVIANILMMKFDRVIIMINILDFCA